MEICRDALASNTSANVPATQAQAAAESIAISDSSTAKENVRSRIGGQPV